MDTLFSQYAELEAKYKQLEAEKMALRIKIVEAMKNDKIEKADTPFGKFTISSRITFIYTDKIKKIEERLKLAKLKEEQQGKAQSREVEYLVYTGLKL